jgi:hypothetical protein
MQINEAMLMALLMDIQSDINYLKNITTKLQEAVNELKEINDKEEENE